MLDTRKKPSLSAQFVDEPSEWLGSWRNLHFSKTGKSYRGTALKDSLAEAKILAAENVEWMAQHPLSALATLDGPLYSTEFSHTIQIPVKE